MPKKINEYDYLAISTRIHAMETRLLTGERMERMLDARSAEEAAKVLAECGYPEFDDLTPASIERVLDQVRLETMADLRKAAPDPAMVDVFCIQYDYHNAKVLLKAQATGREPDGLFIDAGRYPAGQLQEDFAKDDLHGTDTFRRAVAQARETLALTGDPQAADFILDRAYYDEMLQAARDSRSAFLLGYVQRSIDVANLRSAVRSARMGRGAEFLRRVLIPGGTVGTESLVAAATGAGDLTGAVGTGPLTAAAEAGGKAMEGGSLTRFEKLCDDALTAYLAGAKSVPFGEHPLIGYLYARQAELTAIRIILTGRMAGLDTDTIRERLRESYV